MSFHNLTRICGGAHEPINRCWARSIGPYGHSSMNLFMSIIGPYGSPQCVVVVDCITKRAKSRGDGGYIGWLLDHRDMDISF